MLLKDGGRNPDIPASIPVILCARRQETNSLFVISLPRFGGRVLFFFLRCMCILGKQTISSVLLTNLPATNLLRREFVRIRQLAPNRTGKGRHIPENPPQGCSTVLELHRASLAELQIGPQQATRTNLFGNTGKPELGPAKPPSFSTGEDTLGKIAVSCHFRTAKKPLLVLTRFVGFLRPSKSVILSRSI